MRRGAPANCPNLLRLERRPVLCFEGVTAILVCDRVANRKAVNRAAAGRGDW